MIGTILLSIAMLVCITVLVCVIITSKSHITIEKIRHEGYYYPTVQPHTQDDQHTLDKLQDENKVPTFDNVLASVRELLEGGDDVE